MAMTAIDEEIINSALSNLDIQGDSVCFISRLPRETLEAIFIRGACDYWSEDEGLVVSTPPSWVNVSYVCSHWRDVALNCATLWSYLFIMSSRWTEELLSRSKRAPLKLYANLHREDGMHFLEDVVIHVERIQELRLWISTDDYAFISKLSSRAPLLQNLQIIVDSYPSEWWSSVPFNGDTPELRSLHLVDCPVSWNSFKLNRLTSLCLYFMPARSHQTTEDFLATLRCMQDLTYLAIENSLASAAVFLSSTTFKTFQKFNLPHLSYLHIDAPVSTVIALFSCINIPLQTEVSLHCSVEYDSPPLDHYALLSSLIAQRLATSEDHVLSSPTIRSLVIAFPPREARITFSVAERDCDYFFAVAGMGTNCSLPDEKSDDIPLMVSLHDDDPMAAIGADRSANRFYCPIPLPNVRSVHVLNPPSSPAFWMHVLSGLPDIRYIKVGKGDMPDLASVLSLTPRDCTDSHPDRDPDQIFAPALDELELYEIVFQTTVEGDLDPLKVAGVQSLCDALATRKEPRGRLTMIRCIVRNADGQVKWFDMEGGWESGHFRVIDLKLESDTGRTISN